MADGSAHGLGRHPGKAHILCQLLGDPAVGDRLPIGDLQQNLPYSPAKFRSHGMQRRQKAGRLTGKIKVQPAPSLRKRRRFPVDALRRQSAGKILLSVKPQAGQADLIGRQKDPAQRGIIMLRKDPGVFLRFPDGSPLISGIMIP